MQDLGTNARVGILGGTLDPIHVGHIETALAARNALSLSRILVMPSRIPPHRPQSPAASMFHRFAMASLAVQSLDTWLACDDELREDGPSYTALTLERLAQRGLPAGRRRSSSPAPTRSRRSKRGIAIPRSSTWRTSSSFHVPG